MSDELADAQATERGLREQINDLVRAKSRAEDESRRLRDRATRPDVDPTLGEIAETYRAQAERLAAEVEQVRSALRDHEADLERLRAQQGGTA